MSTSALMELLKSKKKQIAAGDRVKTVSIPDNTSRWRILPGWSASKPEFYHDFGRHFIKDSTGATKAVYMCVDKTYGKPCSVCVAVETAINHTDDPDMKKLLGNARSSHRILLNALHLNGPTPLEPVILEVPTTVFAQIINIAEEWEGKVISAEADGIDLVIERTGKALLTKYNVQPSPKSQVKVDKSVMSKITDLDAYVAQEDERQANRALTSIASIVGILPPQGASSAAVSRPALTQKAALNEVMIEDADLQELEDGVLAELENAPKSTAALNQVAPATSMVETTNDPDLDQLMADLEAESSR